VTRYTRSLLEAMARDFAEDQWALFVPGRAVLPGLEAVGAPGNVTVTRHPLPGRVLFAAAALTGRPRLDRLVAAPADVVWAPAVAPLALSPGIPLVLTVHDLGFELRPGDFTGYERLWHRLARPRALASRAALVIVPSPATREQLIDRWKLAPGRVRVVPEGVAEPGPTAADPAGVLARLGLAAGGYLLAVGALEPRKGPLLLARAYAAARQRGLAADLVFAGEGRLAGRLGGPGVRVLGRVSDADLDALYSGALALVVASLLEGYGLPLREALARGTPAVVSDLPAFGAELSDAVLRVPAGDEAALAGALERIASEAGLRARLAAGARPAVSGLSWTAAGRRTRAVLAEACGR
jgi:glycosyltransferase involved in cell wall biosynthesis